jgi:hypothetical protein
MKDIQNIRNIAIYSYSFDRGDSLAYMAETKAVTLHPGRCDFKGRGMNTELFSKDAKAILEGLAQDDLVTSLEASYQKAQLWLEEQVVYGNSAVLTEQDRAQKNLKLLKQCLLNRAQSLVRCEVNLIELQSPHGLALISRGHIEATAQLGYFCDRLHSLEQGNITFDTFHKKLSNTLMGTSYGLSTDKPKPLNIMACLEKADKHFARIGRIENKKILHDNYSWLSDYCHPNFLSSASSFSLNAEVGIMSFPSEAKLVERDMGLVGYLVISCETFNMFYEDIIKLESVLAV